MGILDEEEKPESVEINGIRLTCQVCQHNRFWRTEGQLNTSVATFFNLDWANTSATCLVCDRCGYVHWFLPVRAVSSAGRPGGPPRGR